MNPVALAMPLLPSSLQEGSSFSPPPPLLTANMALVKIYLKIPHFNPVSTLVSSGVPFSFESSPEESISLITH